MTSLAEQLNRLKAPQTNVLLQDKKKPSLLFDPKEAASHDRLSVLSLGRQGLSELIELNKRFSKFEDSLFADSSVNLERSVRSEKENKKLDESISEFLVLVSPYLLINSTQKALEWLIRRFRIHEYNKDAFLLLILPYHESRIFIRALQLTNVSLPGDKWHWLQPLQKRGQPLGLLVLLKHLCSDASLLKAIASYVVFATQTYSTEATCLTTLHSFYTQSFVGWLAQSRNVTEPQINYILPALTTGLSSEIPNFSAGSYMILAQLVRKIQLVEKDANIILLRIVKKPVLKTEAAMMAVFMYDNPFHPVETMSDKLMALLVRSSWLIESLKKLKEMDAKMDKFLATFLVKMLKFIVTINQQMDTGEKKVKVDLDELEETVKTITDELKLNPVVVSAILGVALETDLTAVESRPFFADLFSVLERRYPETFDGYLKKLMESVEKGEAKTDFRRALKFLTTWHETSRDSKNSLDVISRLNHVSLEQRIAGLQALANPKLVINDSLRSSIVTAVLARFDDNEPQVVNALLAIPVKTLEKLLSTELVDKLLILISTCHTKKRKFLAGPALNILLNVHRDEDDLVVFLSALPFLFPCSDDEVGVAMQVLQSNYAKTNAYMKTLHADLKKIKDQNAENIRSSAFHHLLNRSLLPETNAILSVIEKLTAGDAASIFFNMMILGSICRVQIGHLQINDARRSIELIHKMMSFPRIEILPDVTQINSQTLFDALKLTELDVLPLQASTYVLEMVHRRVNISSNLTIDFERQPERSNLILRLIEIYLSGLSRLRWKKHYEWCLKIFFQRHFASAKDMLQFFSRIFVKPVKVFTSFHCLHIVKNLLETCKSVSWIFEDKVFVPHLLLALSSDNSKCRKVAFGILKKLVQTFNLSAGGFHALLQELAKRETEILSDADQLSLILYMLLSPDPDVSHQHQFELREKLKCSRELLFEVIQDDSTPTAVVSQLLQLLIHVNSVDILNRLVPLGTKYLQSHDNEFARNALKHILSRFNSCTVEALKKKEIWDLFDSSISNHVILDDVEKVLTTPSIIVLKQIDETFYTRLNQHCPETAKNVLGKLVDIVTYCNVSTVVTTASRVVRRIRIDAQMIVDELKKMIGTTTQMQEKSRLSDKSNRGKRRSQYVPTSPEVVNTNEWRRGQTILEFVQDSNNVDNERLLVPVLLDLLKMCLTFEEQNPLEYTNQLVLSTLYHLAKKNVKDLMTGAPLHIGLIAQCIRTSHNPQTHHHALLLLVELFKVADIQGALHQVMQIFTFMGNSVLRQDDAYSIQIISKTIETIVPIINASNNEKHACELLRIFVTSLPDIPEHRRQPLFSKLLQLMQNHLHLFYLLSLDSHIKKTPQASQEQKNNLKASEKLAFALQMAQEFEPKQIVDVCVKLLMFMQELPVSLDVDDEKKQNFPYNHIFNLKNCTLRDLRYIKYMTIQFFTALLSTPEFINKVARLSNNESLEIKSAYDQLIVRIIVLIGNTSKLIQPNNAASKYWPVMLKHEYEALDCINNLLPNVMFLETVKRLINHDIVMVRRKALELLNARLHQKMFSEEEHEELLKLIDPLMDIVGTEITANNQDLEIIQQHALLGLKFLAKLLAVNQQNAFIPVLERATKLLQTREGPVLANAALCVAELCSSIGPYAVQSLNKFFPELLRLLDSQCCQEVPDITVISIVSALQKIIESVGKFISKDDLQQLLIKICKLSSFYAESEHPKVEMIMVRVKGTVQKLASTTPLRILLPAIRRTYDIIVKNKDVRFISPLMGILSESFHTIQSSDLNTLVFNSKEQDLTSFFLNVFEFREQVTKDDDQITLADIVSVEESASKALVSLVLKLSETTFRPLYYKFYDWAARNPNKKNRNITFYRLSANIADCLKSLFVLFAGHFIKHAADLLAANNTVKSEMIENDEPECDDSYRIELTEAILLTLTRTFEHDAHDFVNQERFDLLMIHLVDQLENTLGSVEDYERRTRDLVVPCIAAFANAISDDSLHYKLVYHVILKSHHEKVHVRIAVLNTLVEIARKLGKDFMPLLLEIIPMLSEMQEDEEMEKSVHSAMWALEDILEQPLHKYL